jgi:predicted NAD/FAD-dependent oxidoreductase
VYSLEIVKGLQSGETIEFGRIAVKTEDETFLDTVADAFREELVKPLSQEHYRVIQKALKEPTNENIENAKRMLPLQRRASRLSG